MRLGLLLHLFAAPLLVAALVTGRVEPVVGAVACLAVANVARRHGEAPAASSGAGLVEAWRGSADAGDWLIPPADEPSIVSAWTASSPSKHGGA